MIQPGSTALSCPQTARPAGSGLLGRALADSQLRLDLLNPDQYLRAQFPWHKVMAAVFVDKLFDDLVQAILAQARTAFVEVLADLVAVRCAKLPVQVRVHPVEDLGTGRFVGIPAAHLLSSPGPLSSPCGPAAEAALTTPRSAA